MKRFIQSLLLGLAIVGTSSQASEAEKVVAIEYNLNLYGKVWNEPDNSKREKLLDQSWAKSIVFIDPTATVKDKKALARHIGEFLTQFPKAKVLRTSKIDTYGKQFRYGWKIVFNDGKSPDMDGLDVGELDSTGKIVKVIGFFGSLPTNLSIEP